MFSLDHLNSTQLFLLRRNHILLSFNAALTVLGGDTVGKHFKKKQNIKILLPGGWKSVKETQNKSVRFQVVEGRDQSFKLLGEVEQAKSLIVHFVTLVLSSVGGG